MDILYIYGYIYMDIYIWIYLDRFVAIMCYTYLDTHPTTVRVFLHLFRPFGMTIDLGYVFFPSGDGINEVNQTRNQNIGRSWDVFIDFCLNNAG